VHGKDVMSSGLKRRAYGSINILVEAEAVFTPTGRRRADISAHSLQRDDLPAPKSV